MRAVKQWFSIAVVLVIAVFGNGPAALAYTPEACIACHDLKSTQSRLRIDVAAFIPSVHGDNADCTECHSRVTDETHIRTPGSGAVDCGQCHEQENRHGMRAVEGNRPQCHACHTRHAILPKADPASSVHPERLEQTCGQCHPDQFGHSDYLSWLPSSKIATHPKADLSGDNSDTHCIGCHQGRAVHGETAPITEDPCYRCHMTDDGRGALLGVIHPQADAGRQPGVFAAALLYQAVLAALVIGGLFFFVRRFSGSNRG
jgi:hypothetical protein